MIVTSVLDLWFEAAEAGFMMTAPAHKGGIALACMLLAALVGFSGSIAFAQDKPVPGAPPEASEPEPTAPPSKVPAAQPMPEPEPAPATPPSEANVATPAPDSINVIPAEAAIATPDAAPGPSASPMANTDLAGQIRTAMAELEASFEPGEGDAFRALLAEHPDAGGEALFGNIMFMRRHFDRAAWFLGADALVRGDSPAALTNFGAALEEVYLNDPASRPVSWLTTAEAVTRQAATLAPDDAAVQNNFGRAALSLWRADNSAVDIADAVAALERARELGGDEVVVLANLGQALDAAGDAAGGAEALAAAHAQRAVHPSLMIARSRVSASTSAAYASQPRSYCTVDYRCAEVCPRSIVGQINRVTCEMENASALSACNAGEPYAAEYDCSEQIPRFGILIPGLNSGFSVSSPWGSFHATVDGEGNVRWRVEAGPNLGPVNPYMRFDGGYQPDGGWSISDVRAGVKYNLVHGNPVGQQAGNWGFQPAYVQTETGSGDEAGLSAGAYGNVTIMH